MAAVVTTARHSPEATGVLAKTASGALEYVPIVTVQNLARARDAARAWIYPRRPRQHRRDRPRRARRCAARAGAGRGRQRAAAIDPRHLRPGRAARSSGPHQEPQCLQRHGARALYRDQAGELTLAGGVDAVFSLHAPSSACRRLSLPYHIGNGWFGGFLPATVFAIVAATEILFRPLVSDRRGEHEPDCRFLCSCRNEGRRHHRPLIEGLA